MSTFMFARPLATYPFIEVYEQETGPGKTPTMLPVFPGIANRPIDAAFSPDDEHKVMAIVNDLRRESLGGIGSPLESPPTLGIRAFAYDDSYLFFGGSMSEPPAMFVKSGPIYVRDTTINLNKITGYATLAEFSRGRRWFFAVDSNAPQNIICYKWDDALRKYVYFHDIPSLAGNFTQLLMNPGGEFLIANRPSGCQIHQIEAGSDILPAMVKPNGKFVAASPDNECYVFDGGETTLPLYTFDAVALTFTLKHSLAESTGSARRGSFSSDSKIFAFASSSGASVPLFFSKNADGIYQKASAATHNPALGTDYSGPLFNADSSLMMMAYGSGAAKLDIYEPDVLYTPASLDAATAVPSANATVVHQPYTADCMIIRYGTASYTVYDDVGGVWTARPSLPSAPTGVNAVALADHGNTLVLGLAATPFIAVYTWNGTAWTKLANPASLPTLAITAIAVSPDGKHILLSQTTSPFMHYYTVSGSTVTKQGTPWPVTAAPSSFSFSPNSQYAVMRAASNSLVPSVYKLMGATAWAQLPALPVTGAASNVIFSTSWSPDGRFLAVAGNSTFPVAVYKMNSDGESMSLAYKFPLSGETARVALFSPDSKSLIAGFQTSSIYVRAWAINGDDFTQAPNPTTLPTAAVYGFIWNPTTEVIHVALLSGNMTAYHWVGPKEVPTMKLTTTLASGTSLNELWGFSPDGTTIHYGSAASGRHLLTAAPWDALTVVPFEAGYPPSSVTRVQFSHTGRMVVCNTPDGISMASAETGGDFINFKLVNGTFVTLYDKIDGEYVERGFVRHLPGTTLSDISFSRGPNLVSYHAHPEDAGSVESNGRYIYDISAAGAPRFDLRGVEYAPGDLASFIAYGPDESEFVVTYDNPTLQTISYYTCQTDFNFTKEDTQPVTFGPCDFSNCATVAVAHGGNPPISLFNIFELTLVPKPITITDWNSESVILDLEFTEDCGGLVILTPDELIVMEEDPESEELEVISEDEFEEPVDPDTTLDDRDDDKVIIRWPLPDPDDEDRDTTPDQYDLDDDKTLVPISYIDYVSINVTFRAL